MVLTSRHLALILGIGFLSFTQGFAQVKKPEPISPTSQKYLNLVAKELKAREDDPCSATADVIVPIMQKAVNSLPADYVSYFTNYKFYKEFSYLFPIRLMALGFTKNKPITLAQLNDHLASIIKDHKVSRLYYPKPGAYSQSYIEFKSSTATIYSMDFDATGYPSFGPGKTVKVKISMNKEGNGIILDLQSDKVETFYIQVRKNGRLINTGIVPSDKITVNGSANGNYLEFLPDECSA